MKLEQGAHQSACETELQYCVHAHVRAPYNTLFVCFNVLYIPLCRIVFYVAINVFISYFSLILYVYFQIPVSVKLKNASNDL